MIHTEPVLSAPTLLRLACPALLALCLSQAVAALDLPLFVRDDSGLDRTAEPVASGIPLPRGEVFSPGDLRVYAPSGEPVPCQAHQLGLSWPDGSLRWALVQFQATAAAGAAAEYRLKAEPGVASPTPAQPVTVTQTADAVVLDSGVARFPFSRADFGLVELVADREHMTLEEFKATGRDVKDLATFGLADTGAIQWGKLEAGIDYTEELSGPVSITVEEEGPLRAVLRIEPVAEKREGGVGFVARVFAYAGKAILRVEFTLESYEQFIPVPAEPAYGAICNGKHVRRLTWRVALPEKADAVVFGTPSGSREVSPAVAASLLQLPPDAFSVAGEGDAPMEEGDRAPGWMSADWGGQTVAVATKWFWETAPKGLGYDPGRNELQLELWPEAAPGPGYPIPAGRVKTYEFAVGTDVPGPQLSALLRHELRAYPDPDYVAATGAAHRFVSTADPRFSKFADYVRKTRELAAGVRLYGDMDFGDQIGWNANERWNGYHGATHEWFTFYLASGDPELLRIAEQETWHSLDADTQHWGYQPGCHEAEYARKHDHVCTAPYQGGIKVWVLGEVDYYLLTGRRRVLESLQRTADFLLHCGGVANNSFTPERASSLPFLHLTHIYEALGDEAALHEAHPEAMAVGAGRHRRDSIGSEASRPYLAALEALSRHFNGVYDRGEHLKSSFLASYPAEAQHRYFALTGDPKAREGVLQAASFLYGELLMPTGILKYAGGAPWDALSPWMPWWDGVEAPAALAYMVTGDKAHLDKGLAAVDWILNYRGHAYSTGPWSFQGAMGFGGTLGTFLWAMREAGMTQDDLTRLRPDLDYGAALEACKAKCMELREPALRNTGESGIICRLAAEVGRVLINQGRTEEAVAWLEQWKDAPYGVYVHHVLTRARPAVP